MGASRIGNKKMDVFILQALEKVRCGALDIFFTLFSLLGEETVVAGAIAVLYLCFDKKFGERAIVTVLSASCLTTALKSGARRLRPYAAGDVAKADTFLTEGLDPDMSFPSGHATASGSFFTALSFRLKKFSRVLPCALFILLVSLSRLYLGVHYPSDVLAGLAVGIGTAALWQLLYAKAYGARLYVYLGVALVSCIPLFIPALQTKSMFEMAAIATATAAGLLIEDNFIRFADADKWWKRGVRLLLLAAAAAVPYLLLSFLPEQVLWHKFLQYFVTVFTAITLVPLLVKKLRV